MKIMEKFTDGTNQWDYQKFQLELHSKIVRELSHQICCDVANRVIESLQEHEPGVLGDTGLENQWEEICVILDDGEGDLYDACMKSIEQEILLSLEEMGMLPWQLTAIWLQTSAGMDWLFDEKDKEPGEVPLCWNDLDIVRHIRDGNVYPAGQNFTNERLKNYYDSRYEMDDKNP